MSLEKKGVPLGNRWQRGLRLSAFCPVPSSSKELQGQVVAGDGETNAEWRCSEWYDTNFSSNSLFNEL